MLIRRISYKNVVWTLEIAPEGWATVIESRLKSITFILLTSSYLLSIPSAVHSHCYQPPLTKTPALVYKATQWSVSPRFSSKARGPGFVMATWQPVGFISSPSKLYCRWLWPSQQQDWPPVKVGGGLRMHPCNLHILWVLKTHCFGRRACEAQVTTENKPISFLLAPKLYVLSLYINPTPALQDSLPQPSCCLSVPSVV